MSDEWADAINEFDNAIWKAKEAGVTQDELITEVENQYDEGA